MRTRLNVAAAVVAFAGLVVLTPATSDAQQKDQTKGQPCECPAIPEHDFYVRIPQVRIPDGEAIRRQVETALAQSLNRAAWSFDGERMARELREQLAQQQFDIQEHAQDWADYAQEMAKHYAGYAGQEARAIFIEDGESGWLGISIAEVTAEKAKELKLPAERGVLVGDVESDSAAAKAGLKEGDVITEFNGQRVEGTVQFRRMVRETIAGRTVPLTVWRDGRTQSVQVEMGSRQAQVRERLRGHITFAPQPRFEVKPYIEVLPRLELFASRTPTLGINGESLEGELGNYFGAPDGEGVLVKDVHEGTPAAKAGMKAGDVITQIDGQRIRSLGDLRAKLREKREAKSVKVEILRRGSAMTLEVEIEQPRPPARRATARRISA
ncbi:MAG: PDZ domain-containing protein [Candidatus Acidiferrales bacterium]